MSIPDTTTSPAVPRTAPPGVSTAVHHESTPPGPRHAVPRTGPAAEHHPDDRKLSRFAQWRAARAGTAEQRAAEQRAARTALNAERDAAARAAFRARTASRTAGTVHTRTAEEIAPVPQKMLWWGVWADRTVGAIPLLAPLIVSGYFTTQVFRGDPIGAPLLVALVVTGALEGGVWRLARLYDRTLLEGDSTVGLRLGILGYLALISGLIYWHAWYHARQAAVAAHLAASQAKLGWSWIPAAGTAVMSILGVYIWGRAARFQHRVKLRQQGKIDAQAPKFAALSWLLCPIETPRALRHATKYRIVSPQEAVYDLRLFRAAGRPRIWPVLDGEDTEHPPRNAPARPAASATERTAAGPVPRTVSSPERAAVPFRGVPHDGTEHGTVHGTPAVAEHPEPANGTPAAAGGVPHGTGNTEHRDGTADDPDVLRYADHILAIADAYPAWATNPPSVRKATAAIHAAREARGDTFNSMSITQQVLKVMRGLADAGDAGQVIDTLRPLREP